MIRVLLDANALMMPVEVGVRVFDELDRLLGGRSDIESPTAQPAARVTEPMGPTAERTNSTDSPREAGFDPAEDTENVEGIESTAADSGIDGVTLVVPAAVLDELDRLSSGRGEEGTAASVGAELARDRCSLLAHDAAYADDAVVELAIDPREVIDYVLTNDRELKERLGAHDVPVICLRGHTQLTIQNP